MHSTLFRGALLQLFGEPNKLLSRGEVGYRYIVEVADDNSRKFLLSVYHGLNGPAIGVEFEDIDSYCAAVELLKTIEKTRPKDFEVCDYDPDFRIHIKYGCRDGEHYYMETKEDLW